MGGLMSTVKANDLTNTTGGIPTVKSQQLIPTAWVNFNGTGTVAIRDSEGISSITDLGTGEYQVIFTTALANANYCPLLSLNYDLDETPFTYAHLAASYKIGLYAGGYSDRSGIYSAVLGGQA